MEEIIEVWVENPEDPVNQPPYTVKIYNPIVLVDLLMAGYRLERAL